MLLVAILFAEVFDCKSVKVGDKTFDLSVLNEPFKKTVTIKPFEFELIFSPCKKTSECNDAFVCLKTTMGNGSSIIDKFSDEKPSLNLILEYNRVNLRYSKKIDNTEYIANIQIGHADSGKDIKTFSYELLANAQNNKKIDAVFVDERIKVFGINDVPPTTPENGGIGWFSIVLIILAIYFLLAILYRVFVLKDTGLNIIPHLWVFRKIYFGIEDLYHWIRSRSTSNSQYMQL